VHYGIRRLAAKTVASLARKTAAKQGLRGDLVTAFLANTVPWRSIFNKKPRGWTRHNRRLIAEVLEDTDRYVQDLNDSFTNPSGSRLEAADQERPSPKNIAQE